MQTNFFKNADARAALFQEMQTNYADKVCLHNFGDVCILVCLQFFGSGPLRSAKLSAEMQTKFVYIHEQVCLYFLISLNESLVRAASHSELVQQPVRVELLLGSN